MTEYEMNINFRYNRIQWHIIRLISGRLMCSTETGEIRQCTGSDVIRELLNEWLSEHSLEWFPKLLKDFQKQGIQNKTTEYMTQCLRDYAESARINKNESELKALKERMLKAGFTEAEYEKIIGET